MAKMLMKVTEVYRVDDEEEAVEMINTAKDRQLSEGYSLTKSGYTLKTIKKTGESYALVTLEKTQL